MVRIVQPLPLAAIDRTTRPDRDNDGVPNNVDTCPLIPNAESQDNDTDGDGIGNACEAVGITDLTAVTTGPNTVNLNWTNPADSVLVGLNVSYTSPGTLRRPLWILRRLCRLVLVWRCAIK